MARKLIFALLCVAIILAPAAGFSQEEENAEYTYGTIIEVKKDANEIVISEYDWEADEEVEITYSVDADIKIENADTWKNIPNGTYVDVEYVTDENGKRVANYINAYEPEEETGDVDME